MARIARVRVNLVLLAVCAASAALGGARAEAADPNLVAFWEFDDGVGATAADSADSHDGTLINGPEWGYGIRGNGVPGLRPAPWKIRGMGLSAISASDP